MKVLKQFKKVLALGAACSLIGATIFGAHAITLADYPAPFITDGTPKDNLVLVVGDDATASDVVSMGNIISSLQQLAVKEEEIQSLKPKKAKIEGDYVEIGSPTNLLEINETIGEIRSSISEFDLGFLKGGSISTNRGVTKYAQYIQFNDSSTDTSKKVIFTEDNFDNVGDFLYFASGEQIFDWTLQFEEGLQSATSNTNSSTAQLNHLIDREINILGTPYTVVDAIVDTSVANGRVRITLLGGQTYGQLGENQEETFNYGDETYKVQIMILSETSGEALIKVNDQLLPKIRPGEAEPLPTGDLFGIRDIITTGKETQSSMVRFYIGASKITFEDNNYADNTFSPGGAKVNNEVIDDASIQVAGSLSSSRDQFTINHIKYRLKAEGLHGGNVFVPPGHGVREYLNEPEGMLAPLWDLKYNGLTDVPITTVKIDASGRDEYRLRFTNQEGLNYKIPIASLRMDGTMRHGDYSGGNQRGLWNVEDNAEATRYFIQPEDYIILSDINSASSTFLSNAGAKQLDYSGCVRPTSTNDNTAFTRIIKYQSATNVSNSISYSFNDLATGSKQVKGNSTGGFDLIVGGKTYNGIKDKNSNALSIDVNGDGTYTQHRISWIATEGGMLIGLNSSPSTTPISTGEDNANNLGNHSCITFTTAGKQFDGGSAQSGGSLNIAIPIQNNGGVIQLDMNAILGIPSPISLTSNPTIKQQLDDYGGLLEFYDPQSSIPQELTYEYPLSQRGGNVILTGGPVIVGEVKGPTTLKIQPLPSGMSRLASEISNIKDHNAIIIGGPCANYWSDFLMEKPDPCYESIPANTGLLKLFEHSNGNVALLIAGQTADNTKIAAKSVETLEVNKLGAVKQAKVTGTLTNFVVSVI